MTDKPTKVGFFVARRDFRDRFLGGRGANEGGDLKMRPPR